LTSSGEYRYGGKITCATSRAFSSGSGSAGVSEGIPLIIWNVFYLFR